jgi:hypothetical protein
VHSREKHKKRSCYGIEKRNDRSFTMIWLNGTRISHPCVSGKAPSKGKGASAKRMVIPEAKTFDKKLLRLKQVSPKRRQN